MKIGGRIIQEKNINVNTENAFSATYKQHFINVMLHKTFKGENPEWDIDVRHYNGGIAASTIVKRCTIRDAIIYALDGALL
jgi:hypothetical protein